MVKINRKNSFTTISPMILENIIQKALECPIVKVDRNKFLQKELCTNYTKTIVDTAISENPAYAGISRKSIHKIAKSVIKHEASNVSVTSFTLSITGNIISIPPDLIQYFVHILIIMQKLAYLYGFPDFGLSETEINDEIMNQIWFFMGVMFNVKEAITCLQTITQSVSKKIEKDLVRRALTKDSIYVIVKKLAKSLGFRLTKSTFAKGVSEIIPLIGSFISGTLSYYSFKKCANNLEKELSCLNLSDPNFYKDN